MSVRRDESYERFKEFCEYRRYNQDQTLFLGQIASKGLDSFEAVTEFMRQLINIEDGLRAEETEEIYEHYDKVFGGRESVREFGQFSLEQFQRTNRYRNLDNS